MTSNRARCHQNLSVDQAMALESSIAVRIGGEGILYMRLRAGSALPSSQTVTLISDENVRFSDPFIFCQNTYVLTSWRTVDYRDNICLRVWVCSISDQVLDTRWLRCQQRKTSNKLFMYIKRTTLPSFWCVIQTDVKFSREYNGASGKTWAITNVFTAFIWRSCVFVSYQTNFFEEEENKNRFKDGRTICSGNSQKVPTQIMYFFFAWVQFRDSSRALM